MALENLDLTDRKILHELDKNARAPYSDIARKTRITKETVKYRILSLQKNGILKGYYTVIDFSKMGFTIYRLYIRLQNITPKKEVELIDFLKSAKQIAIFYQVSGQYNIALGIWTEDVSQFEEFWHEFRSLFGTYFASYQVSLLTRYEEFTRPYILPIASEKSIFVGLSQTKKEPLDSIDYSILTYLSSHGRATLVELAKHTKYSIITVRTHLKNLIKKRIIAGFRPIFDLEKLGYRYYKIDLWLSDYKRIGSIRNQVVSHPNVIYTENSLLSSDLEFDIEARNFEHFISIMNDFRSRFPEIRDYHYYERIRNYKTNYIPVL